MMLSPEESLPTSASGRKMMVAPPVAAVDLLYPASHMLRSRRLRLLPPTALHLQTPTLWPSPLHTQLEREYDLGAWLRMGCSTSSRPRSLVDYSGAFRHQYTRSVVVRTQAHHGLVALLNRPRAHVSQRFLKSLCSLFSHRPLSDFRNPYRLCGVCTTPGCTRSLGRPHLHSDASASAKAAKLPVSEDLNSRIAKTMSRKQPRNSSLRRHAWKRSATASGGLPKAPQPKAPSTSVSQRCERAALSTARMRSVHVSLHAAERAGILRAAWPCKLGMAAVMTSTASGGPSKLYVPVEGREADSEDQRHRGGPPQGCSQSPPPHGHSRGPSTGALSEPPSTWALSGALHRGTLRGPLHRGALRGRSHGLHRWLHSMDSPLVRASHVRVQ